MLTDVLPKNPRSTLHRRIEPQQRIQQRRLARSVGTEQADTASVKLPFELLQNRARSEANFQAIEFYDWSHAVLYGVTPLGVPDLSCSSKEVIARDFRSSPRLLLLLASSI